jgi:hypothetical protein
MLPVLTLSLLASCCSAAAAAVTLRFHEPVILAGKFKDPEHKLQPWKPKTLDGNESIGCDSYHALDEKHLFGQYERAGRTNASISTVPTEYAPTLFSSDGGASWKFAGFTASQGEHAYARSGPAALRTISVGLAGVGPPPWRTLSTANFSQTEFSVSSEGTLQTQQIEGKVVTLHGIPEKLAIDPTDCADAGGFFPPVASTVLPDGSQLLTLSMCTRERTTVTWCEVNKNPHCDPTDPTTKTQCDVCFKNSLSMASFRSVDGGWDWQYQGMVQEAKDYVPKESTMGNTEEVDLALLPDNQTVMCIIRIDGDCDCHNLHQFPQCGTYRPYYQAFSTDMGVSWTHATPIPGSGCARPRLLSFSPNGPKQLATKKLEKPEKKTAPVLISGGRVCYENITGLFLWLNPTGAPDGDWQRISISAAHNEQWKGLPSFRFTDLINNSYYSQTQTYQLHTINI